MMRKSIGILDSGLGGYTIFHDLRAHFPATSFVFLADQKHAPYGDMSPEQIYECSYRCIQWFYEQDIREVIIACNTISSNGLSRLQTEFPTMTLQGIIDVTLAPVLPLGYARLGVIATRAAINAHGYRKAAGDQTVIEVAAPYLVPLIEGLASQDELSSALRADLEGLSVQSDALILGCTHFPLARAAIEGIYKKPIFDSIDPIRHLVGTMAERPSGPSLVFTTGPSEVLHHQIESLVNDTQDVLQCVLD